MSRTPRKLVSSHSRERGYALLLVLFCAALLTIAALAASPNILTEGKREKEEEMIWRGKQYVRAIKLYYRKNNRFPTQLEDLYKSKQIGVRYLRQAYKDPMNKEDGSWRIIYVGPAGNLIGSLKPGQNNLSLPNPAGLGTSAGQQPSASGASAAGASAAGAPPAQPGQPGTPGQTTPAAGSDASGQGTGASPADNGDLPANLASGDTPTIIGGNIIGVGSKVNQRSVRVYEKAKNYRLFEFIWDPSKDAAQAFGQPGMQTGTGLGTPAGSPAPGTPPQSAQPGNPRATPPDGPPTQAPPPNPQ
jgi:type II secretory pathway pseudopilin PulG